MLFGSLVPNRFKGHLIKRKLDRMVACRRLTMSDWIDLTIFCLFNLSFLNALILMHSVKLTHSNKWTRSGLSKFTRLINVSCRYFSSILTYYQSLKSFRYDAEYLFSIFFYRLRKTREKTLFVLDIEATCACSMQKSFFI